MLFGKPYCQKRTQSRIARQGYATLNRRDSEGNYSVDYGDGNQGHVEMELERNEQSGDDHGVMR